MIKQFELTSSTKKVVINQIIWSLETEFVEFPIFFGESANCKQGKFEFVPQT